MLCREEYSGHLEFDLGNLMASEQGPIDKERFARQPDAACLELATQITQSLVARLFQLPSQAAPVRLFSTACKHMPASNIRLKTAFWS